MSTYDYLTPSSADNREGWRTGYTALPKAKEEIQKARALLESAEPVPNPFGWRR